MKIFEKAGPQNTDEALNLAIAEAIRQNTDIVVATTTGKTARRLKELADQQHFQNQIVVVRHADGSRTLGKNIMDSDTLKELENMGLNVVTAAHVLSGAERGLSKKYGGISPIEVMADTLRMISRGTKVCVEIAIMANDAGKLTYGKPAVCIGGSGSGADTVCIITPAYAANILDTVIHTIVCKPFHI